MGIYFYIKKGCIPTQLWYNYLSDFENKQRKIFMTVSSSIIQEVSESFIHKLWIKHTVLNLRLTIHFVCNELWKYLLNQ